VMLPSCRSASRGMKSARSVDFIPRDYRPIVFRPSTLWRPPRGPSTMATSVAKVHDSSVDALSPPITSRQAGGRSSH
jgi:hypothetical protein